MTKNKVQRLTLSAMFAAIYFICCFLEQSFASGAIQCRVSEGLTLLPLLFPESIIGITIGCLLFNVSTGIVWDMVFGTLTTLIAAFITSLIGKYIKKDWLRILIGGIPPVILNAFIIPLILINGYNLKNGYFYLVGTIGLGELIAVYLFGTIMYFPIKKIFIKFNIITDYK